MTTRLGLTRHIRVATDISVYPFLLLFILMVVWSSCARGETQSVVVANQTVQTRSLTRSELRQIFTGHLQYWNDGTKIQVFVLDDDKALHKVFCRENLQMFPYQLSRLWDQLTYSGQGITPTRVYSKGALIDAVESTPGAISYMDIGRITKAQKLEVVE